jgi:hypothetical protein
VAETSKKSIPNSNGKKGDKYAKGNGYVERDGDVKRDEHERPWWPSLHANQ